MKSPTQHSPLAQLLALALLLSIAAACQRPQPAPAPAPERPATQAAAPAPIAAPEDLKAIEGRWARDDGDYMIEVRKIAPDGKAEAGYFNPNPIRVSRAEVTAQGGQLKLFVLMRDVNYDGSYYTLAYDKSRDALAGTYYQASQQQSFQVNFARVK